MALSTLIEELSAHRTLGVVPRDQLAWLASVGVERTYEPGDVLTSTAGPVMGLYVVLDGHLMVRVDRGAGPRIVMDWHGGDVTGILPYSRIKAPPGDVVAQARTRILAIDGMHLPHMIRECHELTAVLVHVMLDRARVFKSSELLDEKMASLGRLAAGLAHELNNPASAVSRTAKTLAAGLATLEESTRRFCALNLSEAQRVAIADLRDRGVTDRSVQSPLDLADRRDTIDEWLLQHGTSDVDAAPLVEAGIGVDDLEQLCAAVGSDKIPAVLAHIVAGRTVRQLTAEIDTAATRIHALVSAVKGFTYVNQQSTLQPLAVGQGLIDTITVMGSKAKANSVAIELSVADDLPAVEGNGGELNQVWSNLLDNAIDAAPGGRVRIEAAAADDRVVVRVIDDGHGIPAEITNRLFDPFFTTKDIGQGTGLGLDIARRIVLRHRGTIDVHTGPRGTEFRVALPALPPAAGRPPGSRG